MNARTPLEGQAKIRKVLRVADRVIGIKEMQTFGNRIDSGPEPEFEWAGLHDEPTLPKSHRQFAVAKVGKDHFTTVSIQSRSFRLCKLCPSRLDSVSRSRI